MKLEEDCEESDYAEELHQPSTSQMPNNASAAVNRDVLEESEDRTAQNDEHKIDAEYKKYYADSKYCNV